MEPGGWKGGGATEVREERIAPYNDRPTLTARDHGASAVGSLYHEFVTPLNIRYKDWSIAVNLQESHSSSFTLYLRFTDVAGRKLSFVQTEDARDKFRWSRFDFGIDERGAEAFDLGNVTKAELLWYRLQDDPVTVSLSDLRWTPRPTRAHLIFAFDDGWGNVYTNAKPAMDLAGFRGIIFSQTAVLGQSGRLNMSQILELQAEGWEIGSHGTAHLDFAKNSTLADKEDLAAAHEFWAEHGIWRGQRIFKYPFSTWDNRTADLLRDDFDLAFTGSVRWGTNLLLTEPLRTISVAGNSPEEAIKNIDLCAKFQRTCVVVAHQVTDPEGWSAEINRVRSYSEAGAMDVITPTELPLAALDSARGDDRSADESGEVTMHVGTTSFELRHSSMGAPVCAFRLTSNPRGAHVSLADEGQERALLVSDAPLAGDLGVAWRCVDGASSA